MLIIPTWRDSNVQAVCLPASINILVWSAKITDFCKSCIHLKCLRYSELTGMEIHVTTLMWWLLCFPYYRRLGKVLCSRIFPLFKENISLLLVEMLWEFYCVYEREICLFFFSHLYLKFFLYQ